MSSRTVWVSFLVKVSSTRSFSSLFQSVWIFVEMIIDNRRVSFNRLNTQCLNRELKMSNGSVKCEKISAIEDTSLGARTRWSFRAVFHEISTMSPCLLGTTMPRGENSSGYYCMIFLSTLFYCPCFGDPLTVYC